MALPTLDEAFANLGNVGADRLMEGITGRAAELNAVSQIENAKMLAAAADALKKGLDDFSRASGETGEKLSKWSGHLVFATWALVLATIVQALSNFLR